MAAFTPRKAGAPPLPTPDEVEAMFVPTVAPAGSHPWCATGSGGGAGSGVSGGNNTASGGDSAASGGGSLTSVPKDRWLHLLRIVASSPSLDKLSGGLQAAWHRGMNPLAHCRKW